MKPQSNDEVITKFYKAMKYPIGVPYPWMEKAFQMARAGYFLSKLPEHTIITKKEDLYIIELPSFDGFQARAMDKRFTQAATVFLKKLRII